jgi:hypothetical protein
MKGSEVAERRVEARQVFLQQLAEAGWHVESWDVVRDTGVRIDLDGEAQYVGTFLALRLELLAERPLVLFGVYQLDGEPVFRLWFCSEANLSSVLGQIIATQDTLNSDNYPQLVKLLIPLCDKLQIETDEGVFNLS